MQWSEAEHERIGFEREMEAVTAYPGGEGKLGLSPGDKILALTLIASSWVYGFHPRSSTYGYVPISFLRDMTEEMVPMTSVSEGCTTETVAVTAT